MESDFPIDLDKIMFVVFFSKLHLYAVVARVKLIIFFFASGVTHSILYFVTVSDTSMIFYIYSQRKPHVGPFWVKISVKFMLLSQGFFSIIQWDYAIASEF